MNKRPAHYVITCSKCKERLSYIVDENETTIIIDPCSDCIDDGIDNAIADERLRSRFNDR